LIFIAFLDLYLGFVFENNAFRFSTPFATVSKIMKQNQGTDQEKQPKSGVQISSHEMICTLDLH